MNVNENQFWFCFHFLSSLSLFPPPSLPLSLFTILAVTVFASRIVHIIFYLQINYTTTSQPPFITSCINVCVGSTIQNVVSCNKWVWVISTKTKRYILKCPLNHAMASSASSQRNNNYLSVKCCQKHIGCCDAWCFGFVCFLCCLLFRNHNG